MSGNSSALEIPVRVARRIRVVSLVIELASSICNSGNAALDRNEDQCIREQNEHPELKQAKTDLNSTRRLNEMRSVGLKRNEIEWNERLNFAISPRRRRSIAILLASDAAFAIRLTLASC